METGSADPVDESIEAQNGNFYSFCRPAGLLHDTMIPYQLHRNRAESGLMVGLPLWDISLQERQECVCDGRSGSDAAGVNGGGGWSGNWFGRIVLASSDARSAG